MLRTKKDVDRHVRDILKNIKSDSERKLRGYNIARFYHNVGEYELSKRYVGEFLSVRPKSIDALRLLGQIYEAVGNKEKAVSAYKTAYDLGDGQKDLLIKICELYSTVSCDAAVRSHWAEEGQRLCPHHEAVTKLRTAIITHSSDPESRRNLQQLYLDEIKANPTSSEIQSNLVKLLLEWSKDESQKLDEAFRYVSEVEARKPFTHSIVWYQTVFEVAEACEQRSSTNASKPEYKGLYLNGLDRLIHLTLEAVACSSANIAEHSSELALNKVVQLLQRFDGKLVNFMKANIDKELEDTMVGQLFFHLAQYMMVAGKKLYVSPSTNCVAVLLLHSSRFKSSGTSYLRRVNSYRLAQVGHILRNMARDSNTSLCNFINKVRQQCSNKEAKQEVFRAVFGNRAATDHSYFMNYSSFEDAELSVPAMDDVNTYDLEISSSESSELWEVMWLCLQLIISSDDDSSAVAVKPSFNINLSSLSASFNTSIGGNVKPASGSFLAAVVKEVLADCQPFYPWNLFTGLAFSSSMESGAVPDSLCHLDLLAFLVASVYCLLETGVCSSNVRSVVCRTSACTGRLLHSELQGEWWSAAHCLHTSTTRHIPLANPLNKSRQVIQRGLEAVRLLAGCGVSQPLALHLALSFSRWAKMASANEITVPDVCALEERAEHYWKYVLNLNKKTASKNNGNASLRSKMFPTIRHELNKAEVERLDEGRLFLALHLQRTGRRTEALNSLNALSSADAAYHRAMIYKVQADELASVVDGDLSLFSPEQLGQHKLLLTQTRDTLYLAMDRLRTVGRTDNLRTLVTDELSSLERHLHFAGDESQRLDNSYLSASANDSVSENFSPIRQHETQSFRRRDTSPGMSFLNGRRDNRGSEYGNNVSERLPYMFSIDKNIAVLTEQYLSLNSQIAILREMVKNVSTQTSENLQVIMTFSNDTERTMKNNYNKVLAEIKMLQPSLSELQEDMRKLRHEVIELKSHKTRRSDDDALPALEALPSHPSQQGILPNLYMSYYGSQIGAAGLPHPLGPAHVVMPPTTLFGSHPSHQGSFLPPSSLSDPTLLAATNNSLQLGRLLSSNTAALEAVTAVSTAMSRVAQQHVIASSSATGPSVSEPSVPDAVTTSAPHNYQIPLPVSSALSSVSPPRQRTPDLTTSLVTTSSLLASVPAPLYSAVTPDTTVLRALHNTLSSPGASGTLLSQQQKTTPISGAAPLSSISGQSSSPHYAKGIDGLMESILDNSEGVLSVSQGTNEYYAEDDHDPCPDFKPVVPLPDKVDVHTGEENEEVLFMDRAKLYRRVAKEWKERGTGLLKILHNAKLRTVRLLMRRDQTLKVCANHLITERMVLKSQPKTDNVWLWAAQDFADEELRNETFCCRFKTLEVAKKFHDEFVKATKLAASYASEILPVAAAVSVKPLSELFKKPPGSWLCDTCLLQNKSEDTVCVACQAGRPGAASVPATATSATHSSSFAGFKFGVGRSSLITTASHPAKASGSITFGVSGQVCKSFSTPTTSSSLNVFSTPLTSKSLFSTPATNDGSSGLFATPVGSVSGVFASTSSQQSTNKIVTSGLFGTPTTATDSSIAGNTSLFGTPASHSPLFSVVAPTSSIFGSSKISAASSATNTPVVTQSSSTSKIEFGGFSFTTTPSLVNVQDKAKEESSKPIEPKKESIFSSFTFGASPALSSNSSTFSFVKRDQAADDDVNTTGGLLSNTNSGLTFAGVASTALSPGELFRTKDTEAFKPKPLFCKLNTSKGNTSGAADESGDKIEDYEPEIHFEPVVPLPEIVHVKTGEEDEEQMFCDRAKLYRWAESSKEWKERGLGDVKILSNPCTGKLRLVMRREKTLKICANHYISSAMKLSMRVDSDRALTWAANDFSDGEMVYEKFTIKFKTPDVAMKFMTKFEEAQKLADNKSVVSDDKVTDDGKKLEKADSLMDKFKPASESWECPTCSVRNGAERCTCLSCMTAKPMPVGSTTDNSSIIASADASVDITKPLSELFKSEPGSWQCEICLVRNKPSVVVCVSCQTLKEGATPPQRSQASAVSSLKFGFGDSSAPQFKFGTSGPNSFVFGLSSLSSGPTVTVQSTASATLTFSAATTSSPATGFTFKPHTPDSQPKKSQPTPDAGKSFSFGSPDKYDFSFQPRSRDVSVCESEGGVVEEDEGEHLYFEPVIALPDKVEVVTGEEDEDVVFSYRSKLFRLVSNEWKERGIGDVKILKHKTNGRIRILMRREQVHKLCLNHFLTPSIEFRHKDDKTFYWAAQDYSEQTPLRETFALRFKTSEIAESFLKAAKEAVKISSVMSTVVKEAEVVTESRIERARKLLLPDDFFDYEDKESSSCGPDCLGCKQDSLPPLLSQNTPLDNILKDFPSETKTSDIISSELATIPTVLTVTTKAPSREKSVFTAADKAAPSSSVFGGPTVQSLFGGVPSTGNTVFGSPSIFGGSSISTNSIFGGTPSPSHFGAPEIKSIFGGAPVATTSASSVFTTSQTVSSSIFSDTKVVSTPIATITTASSIFASPHTTSSVFAGASSTSVFGGVSSATSLFGGAPTFSFGSHSAPKTEETSASVNEGSTPASTSSLFGGAATTQSPGGLFSGVTSRMKSFADISSTAQGFTVKGKSDASAFEPKPLFSSQNNRRHNASKDDSSDHLHQEDDTHDPHFEPVIAMPDLVVVRTGEENLNVIYSHRAKTFRYDNNTKEWKERGLGDIKILFDPSNNKYRILQRRDQIHKLAVHHYILPGMKLSPVASSETAWCWFALDYSEDTDGVKEQFAVRFKSRETAVDFKSKFDECVEKAAVTPTPLATASVTQGSVNEDALKEPAVEEHFHEEHEEDYDEDDDEYEDYDDEEDEANDFVDSSVMFDKSGMLEQRIGENWESLGTVIIRVFYESDSDAARLTAVAEDNSLLIDHIVESNIEVTEEIQPDGVKIIWGAKDLSKRPARQVKLRACFPVEDDHKEFVIALEEGKDLADKGIPTDQAAAAASIPLRSGVKACDPKLAAALSTLIKQISKSS